MQNLTDALHFQPEYFLFLSTALTDIAIKYYNNLKTNISGGAHKDF